MFRLLCWDLLHVPKMFVMVQKNGSFWTKEQKKKKEKINQTKLWTHLFIIYV